MGGEKGAVNTLEKLEDAQAQAQEELAALLERMSRTRERNELLEQKIVAAANKAESKQHQIEAVGKLIDANAACNKDGVAAVVARALTSELAMLAAPETMPLFLRKYQRKQLKQYRRRETVNKGSGDIICCLDESDSTRGDAAWGKAVLP